MDKMKITVVTIGHMPAEFNKGKIENWKSSILEIPGEIESYSLTKDSDGYDWEFTDCSGQVLLERI